MRSITVNKNEAGQRLDKLLAKYLNLAGKGFLYKMTVSYTHLTLPTTERV